MSDPRPLWQLSDVELALRSSRAVNASLHRLCGRWQALSEVWKLALPIGVGTGWLLRDVWAGLLSPLEALLVGVGVAGGCLALAILRLHRITVQNRIDQNQDREAFDAIERECRRRQAAIERRPVH